MTDQFSSPNGGLQAQGDATTTISDYDQPISSSSRQPHSMPSSQDCYVQMDHMEMACKDNDDDDDDDLALNRCSSDLDKSIVSSVLTADEISDPIGFAIVCLVVLIGDMSRGVMFPTLYPLVQSLGGNEVTQGYAVAAFSFGRILVSPMFGSWSVTYGYTRTLVFSCGILLLGTFCYAQTVTVGTCEFLILAQIMLGVGSGTLGVTRAFVAEVTPHRNRTTYIAWLTAVQYAGFTVSPFIGSIFAHVFEHGERSIQKGIFIIDAYTAPAYFMGIICLITLILLLTLFKDRQRHQSNKKKGGGPRSKKRTAIDDLANSLTLFGSLTVYDACILGCMLLNVSTKGSIACFETLGIAIAQSHFDMLSSRAGFIVSTCGTLGVVALLSMGRLATVLTDLQMISYGMSTMGIGIVSLSTLDEDANNPSWRYIFAIFLIYSVGYPIGHTAVIGLFSKIIGRRPQGTLLGWFASAGSLARITFPIMSGYVAHFVSINVLFIIVTIILAISIFFTAWSRDTLTKLSS